MLEVFMLSFCMPDAFFKYSEEAELFFRRAGHAVCYPQRGESLPDGEKVIMTFGGDGTLLIGAKYALTWNAPLLGINLGTLGFLTEGEPGQLRDILTRLNEGKYETEERSLLRVEVRDQSFTALNDAVITRGGFARLIRVEANVNGESLGTFTADGIIAATPTGSTGYSLSAGGPVVSPRVAGIVLTPVCAHSFQRSSYLVPDSAAIRLSLRPEKPQTAELQIDGQSMLNLKNGDEVFVTGAEKALKLIRLRPFRFFATTRRKLNQWSSTEERSEDP